jgi:hypothetical protein
MLPSPRTCPHCARPLDALARQLRKPHCGASSCRQLADAAVLKARWKVVAEVAMRRVADDDTSADRNTSTGAQSPPAVLWLRPANREPEPVSEALREALAEAWRRGAADGWRHVYEGLDSAQAMPAAAATLCMQCGGGCCAHGATHHAFVDADVLARWQAAHPGSSTEDAIQAYLAQLPAVHVKHGCGFQTATGCALPRESRADVCNRYACPPLLELADLLQAEPCRAAVVLTPNGRSLERAAVLQQGHITAITGLPQPDELPPPAR